MLQQKNLMGYGNNMESEVLFGRDSCFLVMDISYDKNWYPTICMKEVNYGEQGIEDGFAGNYRGKQEQHTSNEQSNMQHLQTSQERNDILQSVSERDSKGYFNSESGPQATVQGRQWNQVYSEREDLNTDDFEVIYDGRRK